MQYVLYIPDRDYKMTYDCYSSRLREGNNTPQIKGYPKLRFILQLSDCTAESGGLECFVGFNNQLKNWCKLNQSTGQVYEPLLI